MLSKVLSHFWWILLLRGVLAIGFGIVVLANPGLTVGGLVLYLAAFAFVDGASNVFHAWSGRKENESWWVLLLEGMLGIAFGVITYQAPAITTLVLLLYIGSWAISTGVLRIVLAVRLRHEIEGEWWMALGGLTSIIFGLDMVARPAAGALAVLTLIGAWSIVTGVCLILVSFAVKAIAGKLGAVKERLAARA